MAEEGEREREVPAVEVKVCCWSWFMDGAELFWNLLAGLRLSRLMFTDPLLLQVLSADCQVRGECEVTRFDIWQLVNDSAKKNQKLAI